MKPTIEVLMAKAEQIVKLSAQMDEIFNHDLTVEHHKLAICAGLIDMFNLGHNAGYLSRRMEESSGVNQARSDGE